MILRKRNNKTFKIFSGIFLTGIITAFLLLPVEKLYAENGIVKIKADTNQIRIGEQAHLNLSISVSQGMKIGFPLVPDTFNHLEVVAKSAIDTSLKGNQLTLMQQLTVTGFDTGYYVIPPFPFTVSDKQGKTDTILSDALLLSVRTVVVDTTKDIRAIKNIIDVPFPWQQYLIYLIVILVIAAIVFYVYNKYFKKKKITTGISKVPDRPAHEIAIEGLRKIEEAKLWQQGFTKRYYSQVTDVIRQYIERRFSTNAMEQTTDEILSYFGKGLAKEEEKEKLGFLLRLADMVKFAKAQPLPSENETSLQYAFSFVENTRPVIKEDFEKKEEVQ
jgi:hypothetical protein